jgi:hypothetical protein
MFNGKAKKEGKKMAELMRPAKNHSNIYIND